MLLTKHPEESLEHRCRSGARRMCVAQGLQESLYPDLIQGSFRVALKPSKEPLDQVHNGTHGFEWMQPHIPVLGPNQCRH